MKQYLKIYYDILTCEDLEFLERILFSMYISKYEQYGKVIVSNLRDAEKLKVSESEINELKFNLKNKNFIDFTNDTEVTINNEILDFLEINKNNKK